MASGRKSAEQIYAGIFRNHYQYHQLWKFVKENFAEMKSVYSPAKLFGGILNQAFSQSASEELLHEITASASKLTVRFESLNKA